MKKYIITIALLIFSINIYSQDKIDPSQLNINFNDTSVFAPNPNIFIRGVELFYYRAKV
jgi:hypothetical protein